MISRLIFWLKLDSLTYFYLIILLFYVILRKSHWYEILKSYFSSFSLFLRYWVTFVSHYLQKSLIKMSRFFPSQWQKWASIALSLYMHTCCSRSPQQGKKKKHLKVAHSPFSVKSLTCCVVRWTLNLMASPHFMVVISVALNYEYARRDLPCFVLCPILIHCALWLLSPLNPFECHFTPNILNYLPQMVSSVLPLWYAVPQCSASQPLVFFDGVERFQGSDLGCAIGFVHTIRMNIGGKCWTT